MSLEFLDMYILIILIHYCNEVAIDSVFCLSEVAASGNSSFNKFLCALILYLKTETFFEDMSYLAEL